MIMPLTCRDALHPGNGYAGEGQSQAGCHGKIAYTAYIQNSKFQGRCPIPSVHPDQNNAVDNYSGFPHYADIHTLYARKGWHGYGRRSHHRIA